MTEEVISVNKINYLVRYSGTLNLNQRQAIIDQLSKIPKVSRVSSINPLDITTGLVTYLNLDGNANDSSGNNNNGTLLNSPTFVTGKVGQAISLNGTNQQITILASPTLNIVNDITIAGWLNPTINPSSNRRLITKYVDANNAYQIAIKAITGQIMTRWHYNGIVYTYTSTIGIPSNLWSHIAITFSNGVTQVYINDILSAAGTGSITTDYTADTLLHIGSMGSTFYLQTLLDEFRKYNRVLSISDIGELITPIAPCPTDVKSIGTILNLTATPTSGVEPFSIQFRRNGINIGSPITVPSLGTDAVLPYTIVSADSPSIIIDATITDSCIAPGPQTVISNSCTINVAAACAIPIISLTIPP